MAGRQKDMNFLNLGCGRRFHPLWVNVDIVSTGEGVIAHNLLHKLPFPDASFEMVYHSQVLEHLPKTAAQSFLQECYRVLSPKGIFRVVVPDLEKLVRTYLRILEQSLKASSAWNPDYEWVVLEMLDQQVRNAPGGEMLNYLSRHCSLNEEFIVKHGGVEIKNLIKELKLKAQREQTSRLSFWQHPVLTRLRRFRRYPIYIRESFYKLLLGREYRTLQIGRFRLSGEIHQWMYDRYSLSILLERCGFTNIIQRTATESYVTDWNDFHLDTEPDGTIYKPNSLYMEAVKPILKTKT